MKLLVDENLSSRLVEALSPIYPGSEHVDNVGLGAASDSYVWDYAKAYGFAIVSKDSDFADRSILESKPPKIIWIRLGNCSTSHVEGLLRSHLEAVRRFVDRRLRDLSAAGALRGLLRHMQRVRVVV